MLTFCQFTVMILWYIEQLFNSVVRFMVRFLVVFWDQELSSYCYLCCSCWGEL